MKEIKSVPNNLLVSKADGASHEHSVLDLPAFSSDGKSSSGQVTLVGAGPGDPDLLTIKAVKALACADVVLVDDLVNPEILQYAAQQARIVHVGKRGGCQSTPQEFIERLMIAEALAGRRVVRLKGGDPFIFGRGGEERTHLQSYGIKVDVINGITSGMAAATSIGVPLTHRDHAQGTIFVTGHGKSDDARVDWAALARTGMTLVVYMGIARIAHIEAGLLEGGMAADTAVALIQHASLPQQRHTITTIAELVTTVTREQLGSPCIIVIGDVVRCADKLQDLAVDGAFETLVHAKAV
ncbi:uroporphyrinogen-III C-methyltransferase [Ampullimonas aquatilis]